MHPQNGGLASCHSMYKKFNRNKWDLKNDHNTSMKSFPCKRNKDNKMHSKMLILGKIHENEYAACSTTTWFSLPLIQRQCLKRPFILVIPLYFKIQFRPWKLLPHELNKRAQQNSKGKTGYLLWIVLKALGEAINKNRWWQGYKENSFKAEDKL